MALVLARESSLLNVVFEMFLEPQQLLHISITGDAPRHLKNGDVNKTFNAYG
jgi:hypothetical protein